MLINIASPLIFQVCDKVLSCGHHRCERLCHADNCGDCPRMGERKCPCGQTSKYMLPCKHLPELLFLPASERSDGLGIMKIGSATHSGTRLATRWL